MEVMKVLTAKDITFEDDTADVQKLPGKSHAREMPRPQPLARSPVLRAPEAPWRRSCQSVPCTTGFADVGNNYLIDDKPIWVAGPYLINSAIQNRNFPLIVRALRLVPMETAGSRSVRLRGEGRIDRRRDDPFRKVIVDRKRHESDKELDHG